MTIFLDSSFLVSFEVEGDVNHPEAARCMEEVVNSVYGAPVISDYVFDETVTVTLVRAGDIRKARLVGDSLLGSFGVLRVDDAIFREAWRMFKTQRGTKFSFTDSTTIELMRQNGIKNLATFDTEFRSSHEFIIIGQK